ncbi:MAG: serine protease [Syntrophaceae bacterium]|nr:serine protease [Syntrophaceae bacterium]
MGWNVSVYADQTAEEILKAVVKIRSVIPKEAHTADTLGTEREGSGVVIDSEGLILTIGYLIVEAETIEVTGIDGKTIRASFVGYDYNTGFGLLRTEKPLDVTPLKLGQSSSVKVGDPVLIAGYGGKDEAAAGRVISRKEFAGYWEYLLDEAIFTAPAYTNFGGAALINPDGHLLGIGSLFSQLTLPGLGSIPCNIFVPIDLLPPILSDLKTAGRSRKAPRPWLGINAEEAHGRIFITKITSGGPAEKAGLVIGDLILTVKGKPVEGLADFYRKIWEVGNAGADVPLRFLRGIQIREITIRSADRYQFLMLKPKKI